MECRQALEDAVTRLAGELPPERAADLERHLSECLACRTEADAFEATWENLGVLGDPEVSAAYRDRTIGRMQQALASRKVVPFRPRPVWIQALKAAAVLVVGVGGWALGRFGTAPVPVRAGASLTPVAVVSERRLDLSATELDLRAKPRLQNVSFTPADASGRIGISFEVTTRYSSAGRPEDQGVAALLAYLVQAGVGTEGTRGRAIDLVAQQVGAGRPASPQVVSVLAETLRGDKNPGVRRKAAEALAQLPPSPETRDALVAALRNDQNPAIRMIAVEGLARSASSLRDPLAIETLRQRASDEAETGTVRVRAASALGKLYL